MYYMYVRYWISSVNYISDINTFYNSNLRPKFIRFIVG